MSVLWGCTSAPEPEPITKLGWFTNSAWSPEFLNGQVKSIVQKTYWVTEENGEYIQGAHLTLKDLDSLGWVYDLALEFDPVGMVTVSQRLDDDGNVISYEEIHIEEGKYMETKIVKDDTARTYMKFSHDEAGNFVHLEQFRLPEDTLFNSYDFKFDENGNWTGGQWSNYLGEPGWSHKFEHTDAGLVVANNNSNPDGKTSWNKLTYDENGFQVKWEGMSADSTIMDVTSKYPKIDDKGNWLVLVSIEKGEVVGMDVRTIEYY